MLSAAEIRTEYVETEKEKKYQTMMRIQEKVIKDAIANGDRHGNRLFIFSDKGYFYGESKHWYDEFYKRAKAEVEDAGYVINGICICW